MMMMMMMIPGIFTYGTNTYRYSFRRYFGCMPSPPSPPSSSPSSPSSQPPSSGWPSPCQAASSSTAGGAHPELLMIFSDERLLIKVCTFCFQNLSERECVIGNLLIWMDVRNPFWGEISYFHFSMIKSSFKPFSKQANQFEYWPLKRQLFTSHGQPIFRFLNLQKPGSH